MRFLVGAFATAALCGCANHPIVDDRTDYTTNDVINKVRCEAQEPLLDYVSSQSWQTIRKEADVIVPELKALEKELKEDEKRAAVLAKHASLAEDIDRVSRKLEWLKIGGNPAGAAMSSGPHREFLTQQLTVNENRLKDYRARLEKGTLDASIDDAIQVARDVIRLRQELAKPPIGETEQLNAMLESLDAERTKIAKLLFEDERFVRAKKIKLRTREPEFARYLVFANTTIALQFRFDITETNVAKADGSVKFPVHLGSITIGYDAGLDKSRKSERAVGIQNSVGGLLNLAICNPDHQVADDRPRAYPITGNIGIGELLDQYLTLTHTINPSSDTQLAASAANFGTGKFFTEKLAFKTKLTGGINPKLDLSPTPAHKVTFGFDYDASREDVHEVIVDIARSRPGGATETPSYAITNVPELGVRIIQDQYTLAPGPSLHAR